METPLAWVGLHTAQTQGGRDGLDLDNHRRTRSHCAHRDRDPKRRANALARGEHACGGLRLVDRSQHHGQGVVGQAHEVAGVAGGRTQPCGPRLQKDLCKATNAYKAHCAENGLAEDLDPLGP